MGQLGIEHGDGWHDRWGGSGIVIESVFSCRARLVLTKNELFQENVANSKGDESDGQARQQSNRTTGPLPEDLIL